MQLWCDVVWCGVRFPRIPLLTFAAIGFGFRVACFDPLRRREGLFSVGSGEIFAKNRRVFGGEASRFADSACPVACASFSFVRRLSSSWSFWFRLALLEDVPGFSLAYAR